MVTLSLPILALSLALQSSPKDAKLTDLKDGFVQVDTTEYTVQVPKSWTVSTQTPWGARTMTNKENPSELGVMTGGASQADWKQLYQTSLYFIMREEKGKASPYVLGKSKQGYESMSFSVMNEEDYASRRFLILKAKSGSILALSIRIADKKEEKTLIKQFQRMVETAKLKA
ncbi:MAG: hypothetical protein K8R88_04725 [Armatimonadetes bacterium]|nr:hypothetical protein [Armatimonadota bacterium]